MGPSWLPTVEWQAWWLPGVPSPVHLAGRVVQPDGWSGLQVEDDRPSDADGERDSAEEVVMAL
jgi:hypothetical protein